MYPRLSKLRTQYIRDLTDDCARNMSEEKSTTGIFALACTPCLSLWVKTWLKIQSKNPYLVSGIVTWYWPADTLFWRLSINYNTDVQYRKCTYGNGATLLFVKVWSLEYGRTYGRTDGRAYVRTESHVTTKSLRSMGYQISKFSVFLSLFCLSLQVTANQKT